ncbi:hypothetical protein Dimus_003176 [Dionaea muscipula]
MNDNGLNNVMELIKRQKWENLFKRRELVHIDAVKEFYAKMTVIHLKKKDVVKSKVRGVEMEFDHEKLATILGIPGNNEICEYVKEVWEESKYIKPLEITRRFANNETLTAARRAAIEGESGSGEKFYDAEDENPGSPEEQEEIPAATPTSSAQQKDKGIAGVDPSGPTGREAEFLKFQAEFERKRANQFHEDLEKAKAENARLLALLHQAQFKSNP